uniref:Uncharacterized protein n=1 Tax=Schistosoma haematobium TaxID=6185 RepID=A0A094ZFB6_SCHHA
MNVPILNYLFAYQLLHSLMYTNPKPNYSSPHSVNDPRIHVQIIGAVLVTVNGLHHTRNPPSIILVTGKNDLHLWNKLISPCYSSVVMNSACGILGLPVKYHRHPFS